MIKADLEKTKKSLVISYKKMGLPDEQIKRIFDISGYPISNVSEYYTEEQVEDDIPKLVKTYKWLGMSKQQITSQLKKLKMTEDEIQSLIESE